MHLLHREQHCARAVDASQQQRLVRRATAAPRAHRGQLEAEPVDGAGCRRAAGIARVECTHNGNTAGNCHIPADAVLQRRSRPSTARALPWARRTFREESGAFTGEVAASMVRLGCDWALVGHSERRTLYDEGDDVCNQKVLRCLAQDGLKVILCVGETLRNTSLIYWRRS